MFRVKHLLDGLGLSDFGLEIAPYHSPLAPKRDGYNCLILDVFDTSTLRSRGSVDNNVQKDRIKDIEEVDFVGSATELESLIPENLHGTFSYVLSSHNFEHLPNPIRFLQACEKILKPGGVVRMAVPDSRACFDYYRPITFLGDWLAGYGSERERPTREQVFSLAAYSAVFSGKKGEGIAFSLDDSIDNIIVKGDLRTAYENWNNSKLSTEYNDTHCTIMTPTSLRLLLEECRQLGLLRLEIESISEVHGFEFFIKLVNPKPGAITLPDDNTFHQRRTQLLRTILRERHMPRIKLPFSRKLKRLGIKLRRHFLIGKR
jgi:SAM-dependent methyltransferase